MRSSSPTRRNRPLRIAAILSASLWVAACGIDTTKMDDDGSVDERDAGPSPDSGPVAGGFDAAPNQPPPNPQVDPSTGVEVAGKVVDFVSGVEIAGSATLVTSGLNPPPTISLRGAEFSVAHVPPSSVFYFVAGAPPTHRSTFNPPIAVDAMPVRDLKVAALEERYLEALARAFQLSPSQERGIVIARVVDEAGRPKAGVAATAFTIEGAPPATRPRFLDAAMRPDTGRTTTSESGYVVFFEVRAGNISFGGSGQGGVTLTARDVPVVGAAVTLTELKLTTAAMPPPVNISFTRDVTPIFERRGCAVCHSGNGIGRDLGSLTLDGSANLMFREIAEEASPIDRILRVNTMMPEKSLLLTMPKLETPPDRHPNGTFSDASDRDYQIMLQWIREGARHN